MSRDRFSFALNQLAIVTKKIGDLCQLAQSRSQISPKSVDTLPIRMLRRLILYETADTIGTESIVSRGYKPIESTRRCGPMCRDLRISYRLLKEAIEQAGGA